MKFSIVPLMPWRFLHLGQYTEYCVFAVCIFHKTGGGTLWQVGWQRRKTKVCSQTDPFLGERCIEVQGLDTHFLAIIPMQGPDGKVLGVGWRPALRLKMVVVNLTCGLSSIFLWEAEAGPNLTARGESGYLRLALSSPLAQCDSGK